MLNSSWCCITHQLHKTAVVSRMAVQVNTTQFVCSRFHQSAECLIQKKHIYILYIYVFIFIPIIFLLLLLYINICCQWETCWSICASVIQPMLCIGITAINTCSCALQWASAYQLASAWVTKAKIVRWLHRFCVPQKLRYAATAPTNDDIGTCCHVSFIAPWNIERLVNSCCSWLWSNSGQDTYGGIMAFQERYRSIFNGRSGMPMDIGWYPIDYW